MQDISHSLTIEQQKNITVTGVDSVAAFSETQIVLVLAGSQARLYVTGSGMKITGFQKQSGTFTASGTITAAKYGAKNLKSRLFR